MKASRALVILFWLNPNGFEDLSLNRFSWASKYEPASEYGCNRPRNLKPLALIALKKGGAKSVIAAAAILLFSLSHGLVQGAEAQGSFTQFGLGVMLASAMVIGATYTVSRQVVALKTRFARQ